MRITATEASRGFSELLSRVAASSDSRNILTLDDTGVGAKVKPFAWASLTATEQAFFANKCTPLSTMTQCALLTPAQQITANDGNQMVGYLRGWQANEGTIFRDRVVVDTITGVTSNTVSDSQSQALQTAITAITARLLEY